MKENKEETKLQSEQKTAEEIHPDVAAWNKFKAENKESFRADTVTHDRYLENRLWAAFFAGRDHAASQFKSQLPIEQKNELELIIAEKNIDIIHLRDRIKELESQPSPIEQKTVEEILKKHLPEFPELGIRGGEVYDNTGRPATCDVQNAMEEYASQFKSQLPINQNMLNLIKEADAWLSFNTSPSAEQIMQFRKSLQEVIAAESQPLPIEGVEREQLREAFEAGQHADEYDQWVKHNYDFDEWLATRKGSKSGE